MLHCEVMNRLRHEKPERRGNSKRFECRRTPIHVLSTKDPKARSVELCPRPVNAQPPEVLGQGDPAFVDRRGAVASKIGFVNEEDQGYDKTTRIPPSPKPSIDAYDMTLLTKILESGDTVLPHVLIAVALEEEPNSQLDLEQWKRWLQDFPALAKYVKVQGIYKSNSTLLIVSIPVVVWDWIPEDPACAFIGYVHSQNLLQEHPAKEVSATNLTPFPNVSILKTVDVDRMSASQRSQRLEQIAQKLGVLLNIDATPLLPPLQMPTFSIPEDDRKADAVLGQLRIEESQTQPQSNGLKRAFTKAPRPSTYTYNELYTALLQVIEDNDRPGVAEVLLRRFIAAQGDIDFARRASTGVISKITKYNNHAERGRLIQRATELSRFDFVQLLAPLASQESLDESLQIAFEAKELAVIKTLIQYGKQAILVCSLKSINEP
jgi:hypothetical protein